VPRTTACLLFNNFGKTLRRFTHRCVRCCFLTEAVEADRAEPVDRVTESFIRFVRVAANSARLRRSDASKITTKQRRQQQQYDVVSDDSRYRQRWKISPIFPTEIIFDTCIESFANVSLNQESVYVVTFNF